MPYAPSTLKPRRAFPVQPRSSNKMGYTYQWQQARKRFLMEHPFCECEQCKGKAVRSEVVDHKVPHRGNYDLFWDEANWQALAVKCHNRKTAKYDK
jgi:5-methylcytosine-specific restriction enzyme A